MTGDFNAKVGEDNTGSESVMEKHGLGAKNENGDQFVEFCAFNSLVIGRTIFPHMRVHKTTWVSPDQCTENQIDHICISQRFRRSLLDVRVKRGADVASVHHLLIGKLKLKLKDFPQMQNERISDTTSHYSRTKPRWNSSASAFQTDSRRCNT